MVAIFFLCRMTIGESNLKVFSQMEKNNFISVYNSTIIETKYYMKLFGAPAPPNFVSDII
jgi:hypothetical protein